MQITSAPWILFFLTFGVSAQTIQWARQFGSPLSDQARGVYTDSSRSTYVVGETTLPGPSVPHVDAFARKFDGQGRLVWELTFGTPGLADGATAIAGDSQSIYVVGYTSGPLPGQTHLGALDAFLRKYDAAGHELWTRQFGSNRPDVASAISIDDTGVYVAGFSNGALPGQTNAGATDAFTVKYSHQGQALWVSQWGSSAVDQAFGVAADGNGGVTVAGYTLGNLSGVSQGLADVFVRHLSAAGAALWTRQFGSAGSDITYAVAADRSGVYVGGSSNGALTPAGNGGGYDGFVRLYGLNGDLDWTRTIRTAAHDEITALSLSDGSLFAAGNTEGTLPGARPAGLMDSFVSRLECDGSPDWTAQFGTGGSDVLKAISVRSGRIIAAGGTDGQFPGQTQLGQGDAFAVRVAE